MDGLNSLNSPLLGRFYREIFPFVVFFCWKIEIHDQTSTHVYPCRAEQRIIGVGGSRRECFRLKRTESSRGHIPDSSHILATFLISIYLMH